MKRNYFPLEQYNLAAKNDPQSCIHTSDERYYNQLLKIAADIHANKDQKPIILLSGPSGSGKTTTAYLLEQILDGWGDDTHTISMDNYFLPLSEEQQDLVMQGKIDLESPNRLNREMLNTQLADMIAGKPCMLPRYDFVHGLSVGSGTTLTRKPGEVVILEGIHALNPDVITIPDDQTAKIYISVRTRVKSGNLILHPSKIRLLRRMIRDSIYRSRSLSKTIQLFDSVELGEKRYIMPYKYRSTYDIDTFIDYELGVIKPLLPEIWELPDNCKEKITDLLTVLQQTEPMHADLIPNTSLVCEFIGGSKFSY